MGLVRYSLDDKPKSKSEMRTSYVYDDADDRIIFDYQQDIGEILASNREKQNLDDGYTKDRTMRRVARIPMVVVEKIMREQGWNPMDQNNSERLLQLLDDPDYAYLKTSHGRHSHSTRREYFRGSCSTKAVYLGDD